jgi:hypothetical protein
VAVIILLIRSGCLVLHLIVYHNHGWPLPKKKSNGVPISNSLLLASTKVMSTAPLLCMEPLAGSATYLGFETIYFF